VNIFIAGGTGFLGRNIYLYLKKKNKVLVGSNKKGSFKLNLCFKKNLKKIEKFKPKIIINCVAISSVDKCETNKKLAYSTNVKVTKNLMELSKKLDCRFIQISTDHLYDNIQIKNIENTYKIKNFYSYTKREAEREALKYNKSLIIRTNFFGLSGKKGGNIRWFFEKIKKKEKINLIKDVYFSPILISTFCKILKRIYTRNNSGIYNIGAINKISKKKFFLIIAQKLRLKINYQSLNLNTLIMSSKLVKRPKLMAMNVKKFQEDFKIKLPTIESEINKFCNEYKNK